MDVATLDVTLSQLSLSHRCLAIVLGRHARGRAGETSVERIQLTVF